MSGAPRLIQSVIGYECLKCVENAVPPGKNPPVEIWTVPRLFTRWSARGCELPRAVPSIRQFLNVSFPKSGTWRRTPELLNAASSPMKATRALAPTPRRFTVTPVVTSVTSALLRLVLTFVVKSITSPAAKDVLEMLPLPLVIAPGKYLALPLTHAVITNATEALVRLTATPASGTMARVAVVQDSVGSVKLVVTTVAEPAATRAWYPANVR